MRPVILLHPPTRQQTAPAQRAINPMNPISVASLLAGLLLLVLVPLAAADAQGAAGPDVPRYAKFEASWTLPNQTGNPFDPADNDVDVVFAGPHGLKVTQPAFWDGDRWRVRFAPPGVGAYTLAVLRNGAATAPADLSPKRFQCIASDSPGFIRRDPKAAQRFVFDSGRVYYPHGMDAAWLSAGQTYDSTFTQMQGAGMNWARVWMNNWDGKNLEWAVSKADNPKPGTLLIDVARRWDAIFDSAEKHGVYIQMTLQHHGQYTAHTDPNWPTNPFNAANGGFLQNPGDFFTNAEARRLTRLKYRYITARYGYSTHLLSYELFNEVQNITEVQNHFQDVVNWHKEMAAAIRAEDVNHHLLTTSNSDPGTPLAQIGLDYDQIHAYVPDIISFFSGIKHTDTPVFVGEWGSAGANGNSTEAFLHDGLWASLMAPTAGAGQYWAWDQVESQNWWPQFASVSGFLQRAANTPGMNTLEAKVTSQGALGDLVFTPTGGWGPFTRDTVAVPFGGAAPDLSGLSTYFQGLNHKDMRPHPVTFTLNCPAPCQFEVQIGTVAKAGAHPTLTAGGKIVAEADFPAAGADHDAGQTLSADLPAGPNQIALDNTGSDWFVVQRFAVTHYAPPVAVLSKGNSHAAWFWAYNRDRTGASPATATVRLPGFAPGAYTVRLWDTAAGQPLAPVSATVHQGVLTVRLPVVTHDIAGSISPTHHS